MDICETLREADDGEIIRHSGGESRFMWRDGYLEAVDAQGGSNKHCYIHARFFADDKWEIEGRYPVPTEPGWYWLRSSTGGISMVEVTGFGDVPGGLACAGDGVAVANVPGRWGPQQHPPKLWTVDPPQQFVPIRVADQLQKPLESWTGGA